RSQRILADALEIEIAGAIIAAGLERRERRMKPRFQLHELADGGRRALAHREAHAAGRRVQAPALYLIDPDPHAIGAVARLPHLHPAPDRRIRPRMAQTRMAAPLGLDG